MTITSCANVVVRVQFGSTAFFSKVISGHIRSLAFFVHIFLQKQDKALGMVSLCSARRDTPADILIEIPRSLPDVKVT